MTVLYITDRRRHGIRQKTPRASLSGMTNRALSVALPLAAATYARSGLSTVQHLLVPMGLRASGLAAESALADYGVIQGMALPVVLFPSCVMIAVAELIVPKLTERQVRADDRGIRAVTGRIMRVGVMFSAICTAVLVSLGTPLGTAIYHVPEAGKFIRLFAMIIPVMYLDMLADGCLKGLGQMMFCMAVNIADAGLSALMVWILLPRYGLSAYIVTICFTELFNFILSYGRLRRLTGLRLFDLQAMKTILCAGISGGAGLLVYNVISAGNGVPALIISVIVSLVLYALAIRPEAGAGRPASG